jgi:hypothetical protein
LLREGDHRVLSARNLYGEVLHLITRLSRHYAESGRGFTASLERRSGFALLSMELADRASAFAHTRDEPIYLSIKYD